MLSLQTFVLLAASVTGDTALIDFSATWCGPCRQMEPAVQRLASLGYPVRKVDIDQEKSLAAQFQVRSIPCFVLVVDGKEVERVVGATSLERLQEMLSRHGVAKGSDVNQARGQSPDSGKRPNPTFDRTASNAAANDKPQARPAASGSPRDAELGARLLAASVRLKISDANGHSFGSGTIIDASGADALVLTCGHVFRDSQGRGPISIDMFGPGAPQGLPGQLVGYDLKSDVGLVRFRPGRPVEAIEVADANYPLRRGEQVINIGCNNGGEPTLRSSHVASLNKFLGPPNVQVAGQPVQGRSGGGLFTADGRVIGVCNAADPADDEGLYAALPSIWAQLDQHGAARTGRRTTPAQSSGPNVMQLSDNRGANLPTMPERMPPSNLGQPGGAQPAARGTAAASRTLSGEDRAALAEIRNRDPAAEVICIVRSPNNAAGESEIVVLDKASQDFLSKLAAERSLQGTQRLGAEERMLADARWPANNTSVATAAGAGAAQPRPFAVSADLVKPANHTRPPANSWKPQWLKPN